MSKTIQKHQNIQNPLKIQGVFSKGKKLETTVKKFANAKTGKVNQNYLENLNTSS